MKDVTQSSPRLTVRAPGTPVRVVTDSISDIPDELLTALDIDMVPISVRFPSGQELMDRVEITQAELLARMAAVREPVRTSQPSPGAFVETYMRAGAGGAAIASIHASGKFSGTVQSARVAAGIVADAGVRVEVVDTETASMGEGWAVIEAARAALAGASLGRVVEAARRVAARTRVLLTVDTLTYLHRNGRLGRVQASLGSFLHLKPVLAVRGGELHLVDAVIGAERALGRVVEGMRRTVREGARVALAVVQSAAQEKAFVLRREVGKLYNVVESLVTETGAGIAANTGPGAYGAMLYELD